jgi:hypothetical protein
LGKSLGARDGPLPNIVDPEDPDGKVGCLGPIPAMFPLRKRLLQGSARQALEGLRLEIPDDFE